MDSQLPWTRHFEFNSQMLSQSLSQPSQSNNSGRRQMMRNTDSMEKASWDRRTTETFIRICVEELQAGNRPGSHFNKTGWENIVSKFATSTNRKYTRIQLKNRWDSLRKEWGVWKTLLRGESGIGWNHDKGTVDASPEWWQRKIQVQPEAAKFRERGPIMLHEQEMLFSDVVATGESAWTPSSGLLPQHMQTDQEDNSHVQHNDFNDPGIEPSVEPEHTPQNLTESISIGASRRREFPVQIRQKKHKKMTTAGKIARCLERMCDTIERESASSRASTGSSRQYNIQECMEILDGISGIEEGDKLWLYATRLFLKPNVRELFLTIKKNETRLIWLQDQMERDMQRRASSMTSVHAPREESYHNENASSR